MKQTALITGASGGLGEEFARLCAMQKIDVILVARSKDRLEKLANELHAEYGIRADVFAEDLSESMNVDALISLISKQEITVLINNAGFGSYGLFAEIDADEQHRMLQLNITALTMLTRRILPQMIKRKHGKILNVASTAAFQPGPLMAVYYATKAYVLNFSLALSNEVNGTGVTVTCLCPGPTKTGFAKAAHLANTRLFTLGVMDAHTVAEIGFKAMMEGRPLVTAGIRNKIGTFLTRLIPRMTAAGLARKVQSPMR